MSAKEEKPTPSNAKGLLNRADALGSVLSSLCAVHCLCMPVLIGVLPLLGLSFLAHPLLERTVAGGMIVFAVACVWSGCRVHRRWGLLVLLGAGAGLVLYAQYAGAPEAGRKADWLEAASMAGGGSLIAASHLLNRRLRAACHCRQCKTAGKQES